MALANPVPARPSPSLTRQIGLYAATAITVGNIIGSGIFKSPHSVAQHLTSVPIVIFAWVLGGVLSMCGSLVLTELAVKRPQTGGLYVYIREAFGDTWGFLFGWANLWVIKPTVIASITSVFAEYFCQAVHLPAAAQLPVGIAAILLLTVINWLGVREGAGTQSLFTTLKVIGIVALCVAAFALPSRFPPSPLPPGTEAAGVSHPLLSALALAMIPIFFAYDGWTDSTYVAGEVVNPRRNMPIAILGGTMLVVLVYVITNFAYFHVLTPAEVAAYPTVGHETIVRLLGSMGASALAVLIAVSTFGTTNGAILTGPRVTQAMAADGLLWHRLATLDPRRHTPATALWIQAVFSCAWLAVARGFDDVSGWFVTTSWLFYGITTAAIFIQRRREARGEVETTDYRTPLYPLTPIVFVAVVLIIIASDLHDSGWRAWAGVGLAALGWPVYLVMKGRRRA